MDDALNGRLIAVPEARELDLFAALLQRRGASVLRCPLVAIHDAPDPAQVLAWLQDCCDHPFDDLILLTGEGLRRLLACLDRHSPPLKPIFVEALARMSIIARGPKPGRVLRELGLRPRHVVTPPTSDGVMAHLQTLDLRGHRVGVQRYGSEPSLPLLSTLEAAGATPVPVSPYVYADAAEDAAVLQLLQRMADDEVDAIAFTSKAQVQRLLRLCTREGCLPLLRQGLQRTTVAAIGPVVAEALRAAELPVDAMPGEAFFLKPLTQALAQLMASPD